MIDIYVRRTSSGGDFKFHAYYLSVREREDSGVLFELQHQYAQVLIFHLGMGLSATPP